MPAMMHALLVLPLALAGALAFRVRGGLLEDEHVRGQLSRAAWGVSCALTTWAGLWSLGAWWVALLVGLLAWISTMDGLHHSIDMGRNMDVEDHGETRVWVRFLRDFGAGHWHGLVLGAAAALPLGYVAAGGRWAPSLAVPLWWLPLPAGAAWGLDYAVAIWCWPPGWAFLQRVRLGSVPLGKAGNAPEGAELLFGAEFTAALFFAATP